MFRKTIFLFTIFSLIAASFWLFSDKGKVAANTNDQTLAQDLNLAFRQYNLIKFSPREVVARANRHKQVLLATPERAFKLNLQPRDLLASNYRAEETVVGNQRLALPRPLVQTFKGTVEGEVGSSVRVSLTDSKIEGLIRLGNELLFIEPARNFSRSAAADDFVLYKADDLLNEAAISCGLQERVDDASENFGVPETTTALALAFKNVEIATDADFAFVSARGGAANANQEILHVLNLVEDKYEQEVGITFTVTFQHAWTSNDPYSTDLNTALVNFRDYWNATFPVSQIQRDVAHLFSGKSTLTGRGLAYVGVVCANPAFAYGLNGYIDVQSAKYLLAAHEIGHNFGAQHAEAAQGCASSIMNSQLSGDTPLTFCQFSRDQITQFTNANGSCLTVVTPTRSPEGYLDGISSTGLVSGWSFDPDNSGASNTVHIYIDGPPGSGAPGFSVTADIPRPDVNAAYGITGNHGFAFQIPSQYLNQQRTIYAFGIDIAGGNSNKHLDSSPKLYNPPLIRKAKFDFDGDGKAETAVFRPLNGVWYKLNSSNNSSAAQYFGLNGDRPTPEDFDGDGRTDLAVYRPSNGAWYVLNSSTNTVRSLFFGTGEDIPVPSDFSGDGRAEIAVFRPSNGIWYTYSLQNNATTATSFGIGGDVPLPNDFDGDGKADLAVFRPSNGLWYELRTSDGFYATAFGLNGDRPAPGDFNGDGKTDIAVYRPSIGGWFILNSTSNTVNFYSFGIGEDVPAVADFDGDGRADVSVFRPSTGTWYRLNSSSGFAALQFGAGGDIPVPSAYVR